MKRSTHEASLLARTASRQAQKTSTRALVTAQTAKIPLTRATHCPEAKIASLLPKPHSHAYATVSSNVPEIHQAKPLFDKILIANRGEIACRVIRTCRLLGIKTVAVYSEVEANAQHVLMADEAYLLGPAPSADSYLRADKIIEICKKTGAQAVHPGYGFLSENASFAELLGKEGIEFIGPSPSAIQSMGSKSESKDIMLAAGVPCVPGYHGTNQDPDFLRERAKEIGYPVLIKAIKGGGGKGMKIVTNDGEFMEQLQSAKRESMKSFADDKVLIEKYLERPRHVEVQVFGDKHGNAVHLFERDCSVQRRHQKIIEEAPAPHLSEEVRQDLGAKAVAAAKAVQYVGAGTVEFIMDADTEQFYFMEMNTRLQVEHPVTEMIVNLDLVSWQLEVAAGNPLPLRQDQIHRHGHAFEARIYAENPENNFMPETGRLLHVRPPPTSESVRLETGFLPGDDISVYYDPMIAKLIVHGKDRSTALRRLRHALKQYEIAGLHTNIGFLKSLSSHPAFIKGEVETGFIPKFYDTLFPSPKSISAPQLAQAALYLRSWDRSKQPQESHVTSRASPWTFLPNRRIGGGTYQQSFAFSDNHGTQQVRLSSSDAVGATTATVTDHNGSVDEMTALHGHLTLDNQYESVVGGERLRTTFISRQQDLDRLYMFSNGQQTELHIPKPAWTEEIASGGASSGNVMAPTPSRVVAVACKAGDEVTKGQTLIVLEAMKTEFKLTAPADGKVKKVHFEEGAMVKENDVVVEMEEEAGEAEKSE